jgi:hypothetical protein
MDSFIWLGSTLGAVLGLLHGAHVYRTISARSRGENSRGLYAAAWTLVLWTLFGSYVLALWIIGCVAWALARLFPGRSAI